jgi:hypothetical protein
MIHGLRRARLLRAHVMRRAEYLACLGVLLGARPRLLGDAEVEDLDDLIVLRARQKHVCGLQVAMDDASIMGLAQRPAHLREDLPSLRQGQAPPLLEARAQVLAAQQLHDEVRRAFFDTVVVHVDDVRCVEIGCGAGLALEPRDDRRGRCQMRIQEFDGQRMAELGVPRDPDGAHAATREGALDLVFAADGNPGNDLHTDLPRDVAQSSEPFGQASTALFRREFVRRRAPRRTANPRSGR